MGVGWVQSSVGCGVGVVGAEWCRVWGVQSGVGCEVGVVGAEWCRVW